MMSSKTEEADVTNKDEVATAPVKTKKYRKRNKKPKDMPRRPLSAYNLFFAEERERILTAHKNGEEQPDFNLPTPEEQERKKKEEAEAETEGDDQGEGKKKKKKAPVLFQALAKCVGKRWRELPAEDRKQYEDKANEEMTKYRKSMEEYQQSVVVNNMAESSKDNKRGFEDENELEGNALKKQAMLAVKNAADREVPGPLALQQQMAQQQQYSQMNPAAMMMGGGGFNGGGGGLDPNMMALMMQYQQNQMNPLAMQPQQQQQLMGMLPLQQQQQQQQQSALYQQFMSQQNPQQQGSSGSGNGMGGSGRGGPNDFLALQLRQQQLQLQQQQLQQQQLQQQSQQLQDRMQVPGSAWGSAFGAPPNALAAMQQQQQQHGQMGQDNSSSVKHEGEGKSGASS